MAKRNELYKKYATKHAEISAQVARLQAELEAAQAQKRLISGMLSDMDALWTGGGAAPAVAVPATPAEAVTKTSEAAAEPVAAVSTAAQEVAAQEAAVFGEGDGVPTIAEIHSMSIVDAAVALARRKGVKEAKASRVHAWFEEVNYQGRKGVPNRNSIYVSLNREASQTEGRPEQRVSKERRGVFRFV